MQQSPRRGPASEPPPRNAVDAAYRAAGAGDRDAFADFYGFTAAKIHGVVVGILRDHSLAEEATQEVYVELWRQAPSFDPERGSALAFAATVARRRAIDRVRSEQARRDREENAQRLRERLDDQIEGGHGNDDGHRVVETRGVLEALARLTLSEREAVTLTYYGGWTHREVASLLDIPEGTAKSRIRSGMGKLRTLLGDWTGDGEVAR